MAHKIAIVTGASSGIGFHVTKLLLNQGFHVAMLARNQQKLETAKNLLLKDETIVPQNISTHSCNVAHREQVKTTFQCIFHPKNQPQTPQTPAPSLLVNCAGINIDSLLITAKETHIHEILSTNLLGTINTCQAILKYFLASKQKDAAIINCSSVVAIHGNSGQSIYSASKAAILGFSKSIAKEYANRGIRVNIIAPGFILSDMTATLNHQEIARKIALQRLGTPQEVAHAVWFLASNSYMTGHTLIIDGGLSLL